MASRSHGAEVQGSRLCSSSSSSGAEAASSAAAHGRLAGAPEDVGPMLSAGGLKWDEANLDENEKIKSELPVVKITEPKTPYHAPL
ncbi:uncharacterized protein HaLaN_06841, partial [Haematococcus lacustris]